MAAFAGLQPAENSLSINQSVDLPVVGPAAQVLINTNLLTGNVSDWLDVGAYRSAAIQIISTVGISAGGVIFEQTNDPVLAPVGVPLMASELAALTVNPLVAATNIAANTQRIFGVSLMARYMRVRISTAFVGGSVQAVGIFSQTEFMSNMMNVQQATAAALNVALGASTLLIGDVGGQVRATAGGIATVARLLSAAATTNATLVKATAGRVFKIRGYNAAAAVKFLKLYNKATAPTVGTDVPTDTFALAPSKEFDIDFGIIGRYFATGIGLGLTGAVADNDTTALVAADIVGLNTYYA